MCVSSALLDTWLKASKSKACTAALGAQRKRQLDHSMENVQLSERAVCLPRSASEQRRWLYQFVCDGSSTSRSRCEAEPSRSRSQTLSYVLRSAGPSALIALRSARIEPFGFTPFATLSREEATCWTQSGQRSILGLSAHSTQGVTCCLHSLSESSLSLSLCPSLRAHSTQLWRGTLHLFWLM